MKRIIFGLILLLGVVCFAPAALATTEAAGLNWPTTYEGQLSFPAIFPDGSNGAIIVDNFVKQYTDSPPALQQALFQARRIDAGGRVLWVTNLVTDETTGALPYSEGLNNSRMAVHSAYDGNYIFGYKQSVPYYPGNSGGVTVSSKLSFNPGFYTMSDGSGGFFAATEDGAGHILAFNISKDGAPLWLQTIETRPASVDMSVHREMSEKEPTVLSSNSGVNDGYLVVGQEAAPSDATYGFNSLDTSETVYIQKLNSGGSPLWNSGQPIKLSPTILSDIWATQEARGAVPVVVSDGQGGAAAFWVQDYSNFHANNVIWGAGLNSSGSYTWGPGVKINTIGCNNPTAVSSGQYAFLAWANNNQLFVQRFNISDGSVSAGWPVGGVALETPIHDESIGLLPDGLGGVIMVYQTGSAFNAFTRVCHVTAGGAADPNWGSGGAMTVGTSFPEAPQLLKLDSDHVVVSFGSRESDAASSACFINIRISTGNVEWARSIPTGGINYFVGMTGDGSGGLLAGWHSRNAGAGMRPGSNGEGDFFAQQISGQRINSAGDPVWKNQSYITVEVSPTGTTELFAVGMSLYSSGSLNLLVGNLTGTIKKLDRIGDTPVNRLVFKAQKLDAASGNKLWGYDGVTIFDTLYTSLDANSKPGSIALDADDSGGAAVVWNYANNVDCQWLDVAGTPLLGNGLTLQTSAAGIAHFPQVAYAGNNTALALWDLKPVGNKYVKAMNFTKAGSLGTAASAGYGTSGVYLTRNTIPAGNGRVLCVVDSPNGPTAHSTAVLLNPDGTIQGNVAAPAGSRSGETALEDDNSNLYFAFITFTPTTGLIGPVYISKIPMASVIALNGGTMNLVTSDAWQVIAPSSPQTSSRQFTVVPDGAGGAVINFLDLRKLSATDIQAVTDIFSSEGTSALADKALGSYDGDIYAQRINSSGQRLWGDTGILVGDGPGLQYWPDGITTTPTGSMLFGYIDTYQSISAGKGSFGWLAEATARVQKVGPRSRANFSGLSIDGRSVTTAKQSVSNKPVLTVGISDPSVVESIKVYLNGALTLTRTAEITSATDLMLNLPEPGDYDVKVVLTDIDGNETTDSLVVTSTGATGLVGAMTVAPTPYAPAAGTARISYVLGSDTGVSLIILSPTGARPVMNRSFAAGGPGGLASYNEVSWDGKLPSGDYAGTGIYPIKLIRTSDGKELGKTYAVIK